MDNKKLKRTIAGVLAALSLTGCGKKSDCKIPTRHVHKYTKEINDNISINRYVDDEHLNNHGYNWTDEYLEITKNDEEYYKLLSKNDLFVGEDNWDYLYNLMANQNDYLMFYYEYYTTETYTTVDEDGDITFHTIEVHHDGWHKNANDSDNTGLTRLYHHRYYGYRIVNDGGKPKLEQSKAVDDIRDVIFDYPYFNDYPIVTVYEQYKFKKKELSELSVDDFDVFTGPNLATNELNKDKKYIR